MNKKLLLMALTVMSFQFFTSCDENENNEVPFYIPPYQAYFLNEGAWNKNDASISGLPSFGSFESDIYSKMNNKNLGDVAQDLEYGKNNCLYVSVSESRYIAKLDASGKELARYSTTDDQAQPRSLVLSGDKLYASMYGGMVARFDTATLTLESTVKVGTYPEEMAEINDMLAVCNSGYGAENTLSIVDLKSFEVVQTVELPRFNPQDIVACNGKFYCNTTEYDENWNADNTIVEIDPKTWATKEIAKAFYMAPVDKNLYLVKQETDWSTYETVNSFSVYDTASGQLNDKFLSSSARDFLKNKSIYGLSSDPNSTYIFIPCTNMEGYDAVKSDVFAFDTRIVNGPATYDQFKAGIYCSKVVLPQ